MKHFKEFKFKKNYIFVRNIMIYGIGDILQKFVSFLLLPIYTTYLKPEDYGIIGLLSVFSMLVSAITMLGLTNGIARYFFYSEQESTSEAEVIWSPLTFMLLFTFVFTIFLLFFIDSIAIFLFDHKEYKYLIVLTLINVVINNIATIGRSIVIFKEKAGLINIFSIMTALISAGTGLFLVVYMKRGVWGVVEAGLLTSFIMMFPVLYHSIYPYKFKFSWSILKKELIFSFPLIFSVLVFWVIDSSDRLLLKLFLPLSEVGLYNVGYQFGLLMMIIVGGFTSAWPPYYHKHNQNGKGQSICADVLVIYMLVVGLVVVALTLLSPLLLKVLTTELYYQAYTVVPFVAFSYLLKGPFLIFLMGIAMRKKTHWQFYLELIAAVINIIGNLLLIPVIGREAAAVTTLLSYSFMAFGSYFMVMKIAPIPNIPVKLVLQQLILISLSIILFYVFINLDMNYIKILFVILLLNIVISYLLFKTKALKMLKSINVD